MKKTFFLALSVLLLAGTLFAENKSVESQKDNKFRGWKTAETDHFKFIYEDGARESAQAFAAIADEAWNNVARIYGFPQEKTDIYVTDRMNYVNALTYSAPVEIMMFTTPNFIVDFPFRDDWRKLFFTHELIHSANFSFEDRPDKQFASMLFGPAAPVLFDYNSAWSLEGLTTVLETELLNGGRGRSPYFELNFKAATLDNAFPSYREVQTAGTSYVIGYLMMRSVADRWGLNAMADIERNRPLFGDWDNSVKLVTGEDAEAIYTDMRISLAKRYADERKIPEGLIISPRTKNTSYFKPAVVLDDGSLITLRITDDDYVSIVKLDPSAKSGRNSLKNTHPEKDLNTLYQETVLFRTQVMYQESYTADEHEKVYVTLQEESLDSMPGIQEKLPVYSWTKEDGLKRLTKQGSFFQPSVSRNGKVLVAMQQKGLKMRLVQINTENGEVTPILEDDKYDFLQPAVNDDGTKVAFLAADGKRARVCVMDLAEAESGGGSAATFTVVANGDGLITDPAYPSWNCNGNLTFTSNDRGRLEVYEVAGGAGAAGAAEGNTKPVVADPIGALWAYRGERGVYYWTRSSSGYVLKMKPDSEWGNVPSFNGPSMPGEIMHFGSLQRDYPDFHPYEVASEKEESLDRIKESKEKKSKITSNKKADKENGEPLPVLPKKVYRRPEELQEKAENLPEPKTELENEHTYFPTVKPLLYFPLINFDDFDILEEPVFGFGGVFSGLLPKLQYLPGEVIGVGVYYPGINNFAGGLMAIAPVGNHIFGGSAFRELLSLNLDDENDDVKAFCELNTFSLDYQNFLYLKYRNFNMTGVSLVALGQYNLLRFDDTAFAFFDDSEVMNGFNVRLGMNYMKIKISEKNKIAGTQLTVLGISDYSFNFDKPYFGVEGSFTFSPAWLSIFNPSFGLWARYMDFPNSYLPTYSLATYKSEYVDCKYPGRFKLKLGLDIYIGEIFAETCCSFGKNSVDYETPDNGNFMNFSWSNTLEAGYALTFAQFVNLGFTYHFDFENEDNNRWKLYWGISLGALQM